MRKQCNFAHQPRTVGRQQNGHKFRSIHKAFHSNCTSLNAHISEKTQPWLNLIKFDHSIEQPLWKCKCSLLHVLSILEFLSFRFKKLILRKPLKSRPYQFDEILWFLLLIRLFLHPATLKASWFHPISLLRYQSWNIGNLAKWLLGCLDLSLCNFGPAGVYLVWP